MSVKEEHENHSFVQIDVKKHSWISGSGVKVTIREALNELMKHPSHCENCGAIPLDFIFKNDDGNDYYFACWKIGRQEKDKAIVLFETDYEKFALHAQAYGKQQAEKRANNDQTDSGVIITNLDHSTQ